MNSAANLSTDHRTGLTLFGIERMMRGDFMEQFIEEYLDKIHNMRLNDLMIAEGVLDRRASCRERVSSPV